MSNRNDLFPRPKLSDDIIFLLTIPILKNVIIFHPASLPFFQLCVKIIEKHLEKFNLVENYSRLKVLLSKILNLPLVRMYM